MASAVQPQTRVRPAKNPGKGKPKLRVVKPGEQKEGKTPFQKLDLSGFQEAPKDIKTAETEGEKSGKNEIDEERKYVNDLGERIEKSDKPRRDLTEKDILTSLCG